MNCENCDRPLVNGACPSCFAPDETLMPETIVCPSCGCQWHDNAAQHRMHQTAFGVMAVVFFLGFCIGVVVFNGLCGGW